MALRNGRGWAYAGAWLGGGMSVAGNVGHSFVPPASAPAEWGPNPGAVIVSALWPLGLVIVAEVVIRTPWPKAWHWIVLRLAGLIPVGAVSAVVSFRHLRDLLAYFGEDTVIQIAGPIAVDGLMLTCSAALFATAAHRMADNGQTDSVRIPLAVRLAGQFAAVRQTLSAGADKRTADMDKVSVDSVDKVVHAERTTDTDNAVDNELSELLDRLADSEPDTGSVSMDKPADKPRPVSLSMSERLSALRLAFPDSIPTGAEVRDELGISSQDTVTKLLNALKTERGIPLTTRKKA